jgi:hypothetical protein
MAKSSFRRKLEILSFLVENGSSTEKKLRDELNFPDYQTVEYYVDSLIEEGAVVKNGKEILPSPILVDNELMAEFFGVLKKFAGKYGGDSMALRNCLIYLIAMLIDRKWS